MISVCLATYNGEKYLREQIDSILNQLTREDELIISDDESNDNTIDIIKSYNDKRIKLFHHKKNFCRFAYYYTTLNFQNALQKAKGDFIFLADQDDVWLPNKIEQMSNILKECDLVLSDCSIVDSKLDILVLSKFLLENVKIGICRNLYKSSYQGCCMGIRKDFVEKILPFPKNVAHDLWLGITCNIIGKMQLLKEQTMLYRRHNNNVSATKKSLLSKQNPNDAIRLNKNGNSLWFQFSYRFIFIMNMFSFYINKKILKR